MRTRIALAVTFVTAIFLFAFPVAAAPPVQTTIPDFTLNTQTIITVTVAITGGQVIVVPVDLSLITQNDNGTPDISIIAKAEQQAGMFIGIASPSTPNTSLQLGLVDAISAATATPDPSVAGEAITGDANTFIVNANANLRAGPGTNFEIIGKPRLGDIVVVAGQNEDGSWMQLENGGWIAAFLLDPTADNANTGEDTEEDAEEDTGEDIEEDEDTAEVAPTAPALPTEQPSAAADQTELAAYLLEVTEIGADMSDAVPLLRALLQNPQPFDEQWLNQVDAQLVTVSNSLDQYLDLTPVPSYEDLHVQVSGVTAICEQAVDYLVSGLDNPRSFSPTLAADLTQSCAIQVTDLVNDAQTLQ